MDHAVYPKRARGEPASVRTLRRSLAGDLRRLVGTIGAGAPDPRVQMEIHRMRELAARGPHGERLRS